jgi:high affinity sulfate transporter 1
MASGKAKHEDDASQKWRLLLPFWLRDYRRDWLASDIFAGLTLAAYAIPVSMAYASLAGVPPHHGIYCYLLGGIAYALFGSSRQLAIGPTSAIAMLVGTTVSGIASGDPGRWAAIAALAALVVASISVLAWWLRLSELMSFVSETILIGFKAGAALTIALTQLPTLFGVPGGGEHFFERLAVLVRQLPETNLVVFGFGLAALALLLVGERKLPGRPVALAVVTLAIVVVSASHLRDFGVTVVGALPRGLPAMQLPSLRLRDVDGVIPLATACFLLAYIEGVSAARTLAARHGGEVDPRRELLGLGAANLAVAFGQGFPVAGGLSQSAVNEKAGARSPLAIVVASIVLGFCLLFLTDALKNLPNVVLAAVVLVAVRGLIDLSALRRLRQVSRVEFAVALVAFSGVLLLGILKGVVLAAIASLLMVIAVAARPTVAFLGRIPGTRRYSDLSRHPDNEVIPGLLIFRVEASILYFNAEYVRQAVFEKIHASRELRLVVADLSNSPQVDTAGAKMLSGVQRTLAGTGVQFRIADAHAKVRDLLRADGLEKRVGYFGRRLSLDRVIADFEGVSVVFPEDAAVLA